LALFRALLDQSNDAIQVIEPGTLRFLDVNDRTCLELGYSRGELLSMTVFDIAPGFDQRQRTTVLEQIKKSGSAMIERVHRRKDGTVFPVEVTLREVHLDRTYRVAVARDITERKRAEQALKESQVTLARVTRIATMGELTATIAHEINQPLAAVSTNASAALRWLAVRPPNLAEAREATRPALLRELKSEGYYAAIFAKRQGSFRLRLLSYRNAPRKERDAMDG
jgi:PAS domain S-box-containing protein